MAVSADTKSYNVRLSNSSRQPTEPVEALGFDRDAPYYDMSGDKYLIILNQHTFEWTNYFKKRPFPRFGSYIDEGRLREVFQKLGFLIFVFRDMRYQSIINYLTAIASLDHTRTSCVCVTILTHGDKGGKILAADQPYQLSEVMDIFGKQKSLTNKPKLFFVQAYRGGNMDADHTVNLGTQSDSQLLRQPKLPFCSEASYEEVMKRMEKPRQVDMRPESRNSYKLDLIKYYRVYWRGLGATKSLDGQNKSFLTVPTHADTLVVCPTVEDFLSYHEQKNGSWMIEALCETIQNNHEYQNLLDMIIQMNRTVAYDKITQNPVPQEMNNKKQMPETRFTLTKHLKFSPGRVSEFQIINQRICTSALGHRHHFCTKTYTIIYTRIE